MEAQNKYAMDIITMGRSKTNPQGLWELVTRQPVSILNQMKGNDVPLSSPPPSPPSREWYGGLCSVLQQCS